MVHAGFRGRRIAHHCSGAMNITGAGSTTVAPHREGTSQKTAKSATCGGQREPAPRGLAAALHEHLTRPQFRVFEVSRWQRPF